MAKEKYITDEEMKKCQKVTEVYAEELEDDDILLINVGRYGFVMLQYFQPLMEFDNVITFRDSRKMFECLWEEWLFTQLIKISEEKQFKNMDYDDVFDSLTQEKQKELMDKKMYFAEKAEMNDIISSVHTQ